MTTQNKQPELNEYVSRLLDILSNDIEQLKHNISILSQLRTFTLRQDIEALTRLLESIRSRAASYKQNELERKMICSKLAEIFDCLPDELTLSKIISLLTDGSKAQIASTRSTLQSLTVLMKKELSCTQVLLADCALFNRRLLKAILENGETRNLTYKPSGTAYRQADTAFVNMQF